MNTEDWPDWQVTKLDASRRQLEVAIQLLFAQGDCVAVHTLAHAAFGILKDVAKHRGETRVIDVGNAFTVGNEKDFWKRFNRTGNFFKHADHDPNGVLEDGPEEENEALISLAVEIYGNLGCLASPEIHAFQMWWRCIHFQGIDDITEPFISWLAHNAPRLHTDVRSELLALGNELLMLSKNSESVMPPPGAPH